MKCFDAMNTLKSKFYCDAYILKFGPKKTNGSQENLYFSIKSLLFKSCGFFLKIIPLWSKVISLDTVVSNLGPKYSKNTLATNFTHKLDIKCKTSDGYIWTVS